MQETPAETAGVYVLPGDIAFIKFTYIRPYVNLPAMQTFKKIVTNKYLIVLAVFLGAVFGVSFFLPTVARDLSRYFAYMAICCNTIPMPTTPAILYVAGKYGGLLEYAGRDWGWVIIAFIGAVATTLANLIDYEILGTVLKTKLARKITDSKHYQASVRAFKKYAFLALTAVNFAAFSLDVVRFIAISAEYPRWKYVISALIGRFARYSLLAIFGQIFKIPLWGILVVTLVLASPGIISWLRDRMKKGKSEDTPVVITTEPETTALDPESTD